MGKEETIAQLLQAGWEPQRIVQEAGFARSTVYKVYHGMRLAAVPVTGLPVRVDWSTDKERYLPGETAQVALSIHNAAPQDLYAFRVGLQPDWLRPPFVGTPQWHVHEARALVRPGTGSTANLWLPVPTHLPLGERDVSIGLESQFVGQPGMGPLNMTWTDPPMVIRVQRPLTGLTVFLSHSIHDIYAVNRLASSLEDYGIACVLGEFEITPGQELPSKFASLIDSASIFVALLTPQSCQSGWVRAEMNYARDKGKPMIILRDAGLNGVTTGFENLEYAIIDLARGIDAARETLLRSVQAALRRTTRQHQTDLIKVGLFSGLLGLLLGMATMGALAASRKSPVAANGDHIDERDDSTNSADGESGQPSNSPKAGRKPRVIDVTAHPVEPGSVNHTSAVTGSVNS